MAWRNSPSFSNSQRASVIDYDLNTTHTVSQLIQRCWEICIVRIYISHQISWSRFSQRIHWHIYNNKIVELLKKPRLKSSFEAVTRCRHKHSSNWTISKFKELTWFVVYKLAYILQPDWGCPQKTTSKVPGTKKSASKDWCGWGKDKKR